ncbi:MAG: hypothetical protein DHS20C12_07770 [Pseudohongiella sp.]|nr:MAG: hypothetical protein DHS20C12_07770 [Pseudohongiella sp.]
MEELNEWVDAYIEVHESGGSADEHHSCYWAIEKFADMEMDHPDLNWAAMLQIVSLTTSDVVIYNLAQGPLEELVELHGAAYIDKIEKTAQTNLNFRLLLRELLETTDKQIWARILRARSDD